MAVTITTEHNLTMSGCDFNWAVNYPEVHKICNLFGLTELSNPLKFAYTPLPLFIQDGPQCGLVALAILLGNPSKDTVDALYSTAKERNFTNHGEMFSAQNMLDLAKIHLCVSVDLYSGLLDSDFIRGFLLSGGCLLVPYDSDKDNAPCLQNGHKAHWAVISGAVQTDNDFFVIARHGKARNVAIWTLSNLSESNAQLNEVGVYSKNTEIQFKIPQGGIGGPCGLKMRALLIKSGFKCNSD